MSWTFLFKRNDPRRRFRLSCAFSFTVSMQPLWCWVGLDCIRVSCKSRELNLKQMPDFFWYRKSWKDWCLLLCVTLTGCTLLISMRCWSQFTISSLLSTKYVSLTLHPRRAQNICNLRFGKGNDSSLATKPVNASSRLYDTPEQATSLASLKDLVAITEGGTSTVDE